ncbi:MAG: outer membrane beta-barrel protein [Hyphomicrobiales bacterium]|nr:outer membrane beta-barrel protein [Hyphomicrobiales bacterium]
MSKFICLVLCIFLPTTALADDWYAVLRGSVVWSFDRSNQDEVEFGDEPGGSLEMGIGHRFRLADRWLLNGEGQVIGHAVPLHGRNDKREATADGRYFWLTGVTVNVWPEYELDDRWSLYGGGGVGPAVITAFGSSATTWIAIGGAGIRIKATNALSFDLGGRYYWTAPARVNGAQSRYDSFGPSFTLTWYFQ